MRAKQFLPEAPIGVNKKRPARPGSRTERGHQAEARYKAQSNVDETTLGQVLQWPEVVNKINSAMKATGWKGKRQSDDAFMFSTKGQLDNEFYMVIIENAGEGFFSYALGTVEDGDPYIDDAYKGKLPNTEASVSELINDIRDGFGLSESLVEKASRQLCKSSKPDSELGSSNLASCKSQGLRARDGEKSHLIGHGGSSVRITVGGKKIKGKKYGGPLPDYGTRKGQI